MKYTSPEERQKWISENKQNLKGRYISVKDIEDQNASMEKGILKKKELGRRLTKRQRSWVLSKTNHETPNIEGERVLTRKQRKLIESKENSQ